MQLIRRFVLGATAVIVFVLLQFGTPHAAVPSIMNFQGILLDSTGMPVKDSSWQVAFRIYDAGTGGVLVWNETQTVTTQNGLFNTFIGTINPISDAVFAEQTRWLELQLVANPTPYEPRTQVGSVGYAFRVASVDAASGGTITSKVSIGPGHTNTGANAFVAGRDNFASGDISTIAGGGANATSGYGSTIGGGSTNVASFDWATVGGGSGDTAGNYYSTVSGGQLNSAMGIYSTVDGGGGNRAGGNYSTVGGGFQDTAGAWASTVSGGYFNIAGGNYSTVGGGQYDTAGAWASTVSGGSGNRAGFNYATVGGGGSNKAFNLFATIGGGEGNSATGELSTIGGGSYNTASTNWSTVGGGDFNVASGMLSTVGGGLNNRARGDLAFIGGGGGILAADSNSAGPWDVVCGGRANNAFAAGFSTIGGGDSNTVSGTCATVPGGKFNDAPGHFALAAGFRAHAANHGAFVWADSINHDFPAGTELNFTPANNNFLVRATGGVVFVTGVDMYGASTGGVRLASGGGSWSSLSDRNAKENVKNVNGEELLARLATIPIGTWNYKAQDRSIRHIGPMAQDFHAAFGVGEDEKFITTSDADGVALAAIQELYRSLQSQRATNAALQERIDRLEQIVQQLAGEHLGKSPEATALQGQGR